MDGFELYELGRTLARIGEDAIPAPSGSRRLAPGALTVMTDVFEHPETSVSEIAGRTGFSSSRVAAFLATLSDLGAVTTAADPEFPGRRVVRPVPRHGAAPGVDEQLATAAGIQDPGQVKDLIGTLEELARRLAGTLSPELFDWYTAETPPCDLGHGSPVSGHGRQR
ncbi:MarR family winged helix-turn-helix transcriptional regulator [Micromonospora sp. NBS 11-29]|uniref:MarR family winged helix-turn-helix transcriptional regulator n=1 Tax=Micromonospora sp. NBS 11-29 TaxID=1960879 RepID=UPI000B789DD9|nr:MarR family winged helix-turn-helix transcriptional regulator [Micromonospora sp. NBS 11-29]